MSTTVSVFKCQKLQLEKKERKKNSYSERHLTENCSCSHFEIQLIYQVLVKTQGTFYQSVLNSQ